MKLAGTFSRIGPVKILVIGDLILDAYTIGRIDRISPEAPVGVVHVQREENRPGGAGNVVLNLISLGAEVSLVGRIGDDEGGKMLIHTLDEERIDTSHVLVQPSYKTPVKNRIIAESQQVVRIDHEEVAEITEGLEEEVIRRLPKLLEGVQAVAISDYGKGMLTPTLIQALTLEASRQEIPVIADPKGVDFTKYRGVTLLKPNRREACIAAGLEGNAPVEKAAERILERCGIDMVMITQGAEGISLFSREGAREDYKPSRTREVKDVTGAGDTVLAMLACAIGNGLGYGEAAQLANVAAGLAIERFGCARITLTELARRLLQVNIGNKIFDEEHLYALKQALQGQAFSVVGIHEKPGLTPEIFADLQVLSKTFKVLVYLRDDEPSDAFVNMLASLGIIDFIILKSSSLRHLCEMMGPEKVYAAEADGVKAIDNIHDLYRI